MVVAARGLRRWTLALLMVTGGIATASVTLHLTARGTAWHDLYSYVALSGEHNLAAYWNAALLGLVAAAALISGLVSQARRTRWGWFVVAAVLLFLSIDEATQLHERTAALVTYNPLPTSPGWSSAFPSPSGWWSCWGWRPAASNPLCDAGSPSPSRHTSWGLCSWRR